MLASEFAHLHVHTTYSKFDGFSSPKDLISKTLEHGQRAIAITDHGTLAGLIDFIKECRSVDIKPVLGCEFYLSKNHKHKTVAEQPNGRKGNKHIVLLAKNIEGYKNLCILSQRSSLEGFYYDPRIDIQLLSQHSEGLICTSACLKGLVCSNLLDGQYEKAKRTAAIFQDIFKSDFYLELMYHGMTHQGRVIPDIQKISKELDIPMVVTNDVHYANKEDQKYHEVLICMQGNRCIKDPKRRKFPHPEFYLKSTEEMTRVFSPFPNALTITKEIVEKCDYSDFQFGGMILPRFELPENFSSPYEYLKHLSNAGLENKGLVDKPKYRQRLEQELSDIKLIWQTKRYDFSTYFLIVWDIMNFAQDNKIPASIRGSGAGSLMLYCLGLTAIDPLQFGLHWDRFLGFDFKNFLCDADFGMSDR